MFTSEDDRAFARKVAQLLIAVVIVFAGSVFAGTAYAETTYANIYASDVVTTYDGAAHSIGETECTGFSTEKAVVVYYSTSEKLSRSNYETAGSTTKPTRVSVGYTKVYIYATDGNAAAATTAGIYIKPKVTAQDQTFYYDGTAHSATVSAAGGATVYYSTSRSLDAYNCIRYGSTTAPSFSTVNTYGSTVYYCAVPNAGLDSITAVSGSFKVKLNKGQVTIPSGISLPYKGISQDGIAASARYSRSGTYNATSPGTYSAKLRLTDTSNYEWSDGTTYSKSVSWTITKAPISLARAKAVVGCVYNGRAWTPVPTLTLGGKVLKKNTDYTMSYSNNVNAGTATISYTGIGTYFSGRGTFTFTIEKAVPSMNFTTATIRAYVGGSTPKNPLVYLGDGAVSYTSSNTAVAAVSSTGVLTITGAPGTTTITATASAGNNYQAATVSYVISVSEPTSLSSASAKLSKPLAYTGKTMRSVFIVKVGSRMLLEGIDYRVSYSKSPKAVGSYKATITGVEAYAGTLSVGFDILPKAPKIYSSSRDLAIDGQAQHTIKWRKVGNISGYEMKIVCAGKTTYVKYNNKKNHLGSKKTSKPVVTKTGKKTKVMLRTYKMVSGKPYFSSWTSVKYKA